MNPDLLEKIARFVSDREYEGIYQAIEVKAFWRTHTGYHSSQSILVVLVVDSGYQSRDFIVRVDPDNSLKFGEIDRAWL